MRRAWAMGVVVGVLLAGAACADPPNRGRGAGSGTAGADRSVAMVKPSPHAGSAAVNRQVCAAAAAATADGLTVFDAQMSALELAAAHNDETTMIAAGTLIRDKLVVVAATLEALSHRSTSAPVTATLARASRTLHDMSSESYEGTSADQRRTLAELATTFAETCD